MRIEWFVFFLVGACGNVQAPISTDAALHADAPRSVDAAHGDAGLCATTDPAEQCRQIMLPRCDALERCEPGTPNIKAQCIVDTMNACGTTHLLMTTSHCLSCNAVWAPFGTQNPPVCSSQESQNCGQCYGFATPPAMCPEAPPVAP